MQIIGENKSQPACTFNVLDDHYDRKKEEEEQKQTTKLLVRSSTTQFVVCLFWSLLNAICLLLLANYGYWKNQISVRTSTQMTSQQSKIQVEFLCVCASMDHTAMKLNKIQNLRSEKRTQLKWAKKWWCSSSCAHVETSTITYSHQ